MNIEQIKKDWEQDCIRAGFEPYIEDFGGYLNLTVTGYSCYISTPDEDPAELFIGFYKERYKTTRDKVEDLQKLFTSFYEKLIKE